MNIGSEYKVIGIPACVKTSQTAICIEANSITFCIPKGKENVNIIFNNTCKFKSICSGNKYWLPCVLDTLQNTRDRVVIRTVKVPTLKSYGK